MIREVVQEQRMPPWHADPKIGHFRNDARLSDKDKELINKWVEAGAPRATPRTCPPRRNLSQGWQIPTPDEVVYMADEPHDVPATGTVEYQRFVVDPGWTEDKWIKAMECMPGNPSVVHHIIVYLVPPGVTPSGQAGRLRTNWLGAFAPGLRPQVLDDGLARYVQKGLEAAVRDALHAERHRAERTAATWASSLPIRQKVKKEVAVQNAGNFTFKIPPSDPNYEVESEFVFRQKALLLSISPHMHVRGKDFRYDLIFPDGKTRNDLVGSPLRLRLANDLSTDRAEGSCPRARRCTAWPTSTTRPTTMANPDPTQGSLLGRADLGRNDVRLVRDVAGRPGPDAAGHRRRPIGSRSSWHRPTQSRSTTN